MHRRQGTEGDFRSGESFDVQWDDFLNTKLAKNRQDVQFQDRIVIPLRGWLHTFAL